MPMPHSGLSILIVAPVGQDARLIQKALAAAHMDARIMPSIGDAIAHVSQDNVGALLLAEEVLRPADIERLTAELKAQQPWSDLPLLILTVGGKANSTSRQRERDRLPLGSVTLLERPIRMATLVSSVRSALSSRSRQYEVRDTLIERDIAEAALRESESRLRLAIEAAHLGSWELDLDHGILQASDTCRKTYDWPLDQPLRFSDLMERVHPEDRAAMRDALNRAVETHTPYAADYRVVWRDDSIHWISASGRILGDGEAGIVNSASSTSGNSSRRMAGVTLDITDRVLSEEALRKADKLALVGRLSSSIAHEINNPLESVTNLLYLLSQSGLESENKAYVLTAQQELARVSEIVSQTLSFNRQANLHAEAAIPQILDSVLALYQGRLTTSGIKVERRFTSGTRVLCYPGEIRQVFTNLIGNAFDATRKGGRIILRERKATHPRTGQCGIRITVADTGTGISPKNRSRIFEAFHSTKGNNGTGLGLWISKGIVEKHGGSLRFSSSTRPSRSGTVLSVFMPLAAGVAPRLTASWHTNTHTGH